MRLENILNELQEFLISRNLSYLISVDFKRLMLVHINLNNFWNLKIKLYECIAWYYQICALLWKDYRIFQNNLHFPINFQIVGLWFPQCVICKDFDNLTNFHFIWIWKPSILDKVKIYSCLKKFYIKSFSWENSCDQEYLEEFKKEKFCY